MRVPRISDSLRVFSDEILGVKKAVLFDILGMFLFQQFHPNAGPAGYEPSAERVVETTPPMEKSAEAMSGTSVPVPEGSIIPPLKTAGKKPPVLWFAAGVQAWVALGYAGSCFFLMQWERTRPAENLAEIVF
ncbi:MAG: hypothetical protein EAZ42_07260 [Verrucomicrobia bacterium]|nr:MAG: hypothetical protein EAZ42_07260 [Verrucomicrobiota bacterium]